MFLLFSDNLPSLGVPWKSTLQNLNSYAVFKSEVVSGFVTKMLLRPTTKNRKQWDPETGQAMPHHQIMKLDASGTVFVISYEVVIT